MGGRKQQIDKNVAKRQKLKAKWDRHCKYSADEVDNLSNRLEMFSHDVEVEFSTNEEAENWVRMLDEGVVVDGDGEVYAVIKKGVLKSFYDELPDDFEGYIDKDHVRAIRLGEYTKENIRLVELDNDRHALEVNVKLDANYYATRDLLRQNEHRAVSVEMMTDVDEFALASKVTGEKQKWDYLVPLIGAVDILGYAVCENPKNANSIKDDLLDKASAEGENMDEELKKLVAEEVEQVAEATAEADEQDDTPAEPEVKAENSTVEEEQLDYSAEEETAEEADEKSEDSEGDAEATAEGLEQLGNAIKELRAELAEKDKKIAELENQLTARAEKKLSTAEKIAELLNFARGSEPTAAEGSGVKTSSEADKYAMDDALWEEAAKSLEY